ARVHAKICERSFEFQSRPARVFEIRVRDFNSRVRRYHLSRFCYSLVINEDFAGHDWRSRTLRRLRKFSRHERGIHSGTFSFRSRTRRVHKVKLIFGAIREEAKLPRNRKGKSCQPLNYTSRSVRWRLASTVVAWRSR